MEIRYCEFPDLVEIFPQTFNDSRGYFRVSFDEKLFRDVGIPAYYPQDNESFSVKGTLRGLHFQKGSLAQGKLVRVLRGRVQDVVVDLRPDSPTFKQWKSFYIDDLGKMLYVPEGFAHGFLALEDTIFAYKCTNLYEKSAEDGIRWNDSTLNISWELEGLGQPLVSEKDQLLPLLGD